MSSDKFTCRECGRVVRVDRYEGKRMTEYMGLKRFGLCHECIKR